MQIILASSSPYRKELLSKLGISFDTYSPEVDEDPIKHDPKFSIEEKAIKLSVLKAKAVQDQYPNSLIIGSDQICHLNGEILSKSGSLAKSEEILKKLSGKTHELVTAYAIIHTNQVLTHCEVTSLKMRNLSSLQVKNYLRLDNPIDCAGSYKLELNGIGLFEKIETKDHTAIVGLPLIQLGNDLARLNIEIPGTKA
tara:strand:- start:61715 stop:62305 length:591 start_codon:yes stop_codon:yes gene_type:complete